MEGQNKILFIGSPLANVKDIIKNLTKISNYETINIESIDIYATIFTIDTKYYTASVVIWNLENINAINESIQDKIIENCEAVVLVYDTTKPETFEYIKTWASLVEDLGPSVSICYGAGPLSSIAKDHEKWCINHSIEHVLDFPLHTDEDEDNAYPDKFGLARVMEALEANMWPNMEFKTQQRPVKATIVEGIEEDIEVEITRDNEIVQVTETTTVTTSVQIEEEEPSKPKLSKTERRERALQREAQEKAKQEEIEAAKKTAKPKKEEKVKKRITTEELLDIDEEPEAKSAEEEKMDKEMANFEKMFLNLNSLRDRAKNMPDSDRRDFAAKMVMSLLGTGSDDDEDFL